MEDEVLTEIPVQYNRIKDDTGRLSFQMNSDLLTGSLLKTLVASTELAPRACGKGRYFYSHAGIEKRSYSDKIEMVNRNHNRSEKINYPTIYARRSDFSVTFLLFNI